MRRYFFVLSLVGFFLVFFLLFTPSAVFAQSVVINEFYPTDPEWVEFYNGGAVSVDLSSFWFDDDTSFSSDAGSSAKKQLSGILPAGSVCYLDLNRFLNNDGDSPTLFGSTGEILDTYTYTSFEEGKSYSRIPDGGEWNSGRSPTKAAVSCASLTPTPNPSSTPIPTQSSTSSQNTSTVKISQPKDQNGVDILGSLKIYIDGNYTGNYAPETYTFGDGKTCGSNNVSCGFGTHIFKVEKTGYLPWTKTADITAGSNYEFDPVLILASPSPTPTIKLSPTATASATPKSTSVDISTSTTSALLAEDIFSNESVLGAESVEKTPPPEENITADPKLKAAALFFITAGVSFLVSAVYAYIRSRNRKKINEDKTNEVEEESEQTP